ncbi:hypothetical protein J6590_092747 [Homalodisca vitripennis]|nr:hypothetical protein J6590_092747 [Homalodisca vitripennis]
MRVSRVLQTSALRQEWTSEIIHQGADDLAELNVLSGSILGVRATMARDDDDLGTGTNDRASSRGSCLE